MRSFYMILAWAASWSWLAIARSEIDFAAIGLLMVIATLGLVEEGER